MKIIKNFTLGILGVFFLSLGLYACSNDDVTKETEENIQENIQGKSFDSKVSSMRINNGIPSASPNNILVFESREALETIFNEMTLEYDKHNEVLDQKIPNDLEDDDLEDFIIKNNLDEDYTLNNFEKQLGFKSLRKTINEAEAAWLENQGEVMDISTDPDNHFIVSDFERTLLNEGSELIIKDAEKKPVIFKYFDWGHIEVSDLNTEILKEINQGNINDPQVLENMAASNSFLKIFNKNKDGVIVSGCRKSGTRVEYYNVQGQQIKGFTSQNNGLFDNTLVSKTKGYLWKRGKWRNRKVWIHAGVTGINRGNWKVHNRCVDVIDGAGHWKDKKRYKLEYRVFNPNPIIMDVKDNFVYSYHSQGGKSIVVDFYDYNTVQF